MKALPENFEALSNEWLNFKAYKVKESTIQKYKVIICTHILPEFGSIKTNEMSTPFINKKMMELYQDCRSKLSYSSIRCIFYILKAIITYGINNEYFPQVYFTFEFSKENTNTEIQILSKSQEKTVLNQVSKEKHPNNVVNSLSCHHSNLSGCHNPAHLSVTDSCRHLMIGRSFFYKVKIGNGISFLHTS